MIGDYSSKSRREIWEQQHRPDTYRPRLYLDNTEILDKFINILPPESTVLDYGCSEGKIAEYLFQHRLKLTCADIAENALELTKQRINSPLLTTLQANSPNDILDRQFDGIFCGGVLHHISPEERPNYIHTFYSMLKPHGVLLLTGHSTKTEDFANGTRISPATGFISHAIDEIEPLLTQEGFSIKENGYIEGKEPKSPMQRYLKYFLATK